jgi:predicted RNA-binding Zn-ribbon protein involved in translation (DUF1610 family)
MNWTLLLHAAAAVVGVLVNAAIAAVVVVLVRTERLVKSAASRLAALPCPACGVAIGHPTAAAVAAARKAEGQRIWNEAQRKGRRIPRIDPRWRFPCPSCGAALRFDPGAARDPLTGV